MVQLLLKSGAKPNVVMNGWSPHYEVLTKYGISLQTAVVGGHEKVVRLLLDYVSSSDDEERVEHKAVDPSDSDGDKNDTSGNYTDKDDVFHSPPQSLLYGSYGGYDDGPTEVASVATIDINSGTFGTALQAACFTGNESMVKFLISKGQIQISREELTGQHFKPLLTVDLKRLYKYC